MNRIRPTDLLDIGLPDMDGLTMLRRIQKDREIPVIFLTARRRDLDEVLGLELGAEDYITKPFSEDVLLARIKTVLRRNERLEPATSCQSRLIVAGDLVIDPGAHRHLRRPARRIGPKAFDLLRVLALNCGQVMSVNELLEQVWGADPSASRRLYMSISAGCVKSWKKILLSHGAS